MVECDPESGTVCFPRRTIHVLPRSRRLFLCTRYRNRACTSPGNVHIWGMRAYEVTNGAALSGERNQG
jgi:hypothetical protein